MILHIKIFYRRLIDYLETPSIESGMVIHGKFSKLIPNDSKRFQLENVGNAIKRNIPQYSETRRNDIHRTSRMFIQIL